MPQSIVQRSILVGLVAGAATGGALVGIGLRAGTPARPLNAMAAYLLSGDTAGVLDFHPRITPVGLGIHLVVAIGLALVTLTLIERARLRPFAAALLVAAAALAGSVAMARWGGQGLGALLPIGDLIVTYLVLATALALGSWLVPDPVPDDRFLAM